MNNVTLKLNNLQVPVKHFTFNGGEEQVIIDQAVSPKGDIGYVDITAKLKSSQDVMVLVMLTHADRSKRPPQTVADGLLDYYVENSDKLAEEVYEGSNALVITINHQNEVMDL